MASLKSHSNSVAKKDYLLGLSLDNSELKFNPKKPGHFELVAQVDSSNKHSWSHVDGDKGHVSSKHIARNYKEYLSHQGNLKDGEKNPIIGALPSGNGDHGFLYELKGLKQKGEGEFVLKGRLLDHDLVRQHQDQFSAAYGRSVIHNHLRFDHSVTIQPSESARQLPSFRRLGGQAESFEFGRAPLEFSFGGLVSSIGSGVSSVANSVASGVTSTVNSVANLGSSVGNTIANGFNGFGSTVSGVASSVNWGGFGNSIISPIASFGGIVGNFFGGSKSTSFDLTWPSLSVSGGEGPFSASLSATPSMSGDLNFNSGYFGALNPSTVSLKFSPSLPIRGQVGVDLGSASAGASTTIDGPSVSTAAPVIGEATLSSAVDFALELDGSLGEGVGQMGATVDFSPGAAFTLSTKHASFSNTTKHPVVTTQLPAAWDSLAPQASLKMTATPSLTLTAGPTIPDSIPYVGGRGLATLDTTFENPIAFSVDLSDPDQLDIAVSGNISSQFQFFGADVDPPLVSANLYGPINSTVAI